MDLNNDLLGIKSPETEKSSEYVPVQSPLSDRPTIVNVDLSKTTSYVSNDVKINVELVSDNLKVETPPNPYEIWLKKFNERMEKLKIKEAQDIENRIKAAAQELEDWHKDRKKQIEEKLKKLQEEESNKPADKNEFDWIKTAKYLQTSEFFIKDQSGGQNQKLIDLIIKKRTMLEKENAPKEQAVNSVI